MGRYIINRLIQSIPTIIGITMVSFLLVHIVPGGPAYTMLGPKATPARVAAVNRQLGLNQPLYVQYGIWFWQILHGNLGQSYFLNASVASLIAQNLPRTLAVVGLSIIFAHLFAILLGSFQGYYKNKWHDHVLTGVNYFFYSMPTFWLGIILLLYGAVILGWFPASGIANPNQPQTFGDWLSALFLPSLTLMITSVAGWARYMRNSMTDTMVQDYVRTARAKGLSEVRVVLKHALRNSVLPLITLLGLSLPGLFAGAVFVEVIFNYPGMGLLLYNAAIKKDYPVVMAGVLIAGLLTIIGNLLADVLYALVDPRIQYN